MKLQPNLENKLKLEQKINPTLLQQLNILHLPQLELNKLIEKIVEENPFVEKEEEEEEELEEETIEDTSPFVEWEYNPEEERKKPLLPYRVDWREYLLSQLELSLEDEGLKKIGKHLIYNLNSRGYISFSLEKVSRELKVPISKIEYVLKEIQNLDPPGIGARDLKECLELQLKRNKWKGYNVGLMILDKCFKEFISLNYDVISEKLNLSKEKVEEGINCIKKCTPYPAKALEGEVRYVFPDVILREDSDGWVVFPSIDWVAKLKLSPVYQEMIEKPHTLSPTDYRYLKEKKRNAVVFLKALQKREETLNKISLYIANKESAFFKGEKKTITFVTLTEIAKEIGRDPSTVSRAINNKWIQTPQGMFKLKNFFSKGKLPEGEKIKERIKELIQKENKENPLKDTEIQEILNKEGYKIARTTVIKYRKELNIPERAKRLKKVIQK